MAAYGGIMGMDGRKQYGIGSYFQKLKDKLFGNPVATAALLAGGDYLVRKDQSLLSSALKNLPKKAADFILGEETIKQGKSERGPNLVRRILDAPGTSKDTTLGQDIRSSIIKNIVPIVGGIGAGLFTKNQDTSSGLPSDNTALNLAEYKKAANLLNQQQGLAADMNFLPDVAARKFTPEEMALQYSQTAANGGRIGYSDAGSVMKDPAEVIKKIGSEFGGGLFSGSMAQDQGESMIEKIQDYKYRTSQSMEDAIAELESKWDQAVESGQDPKKASSYSDFNPFSFFEKLGIRSKEDIRRRIELGWEEAKGPTTDTGIMTAANGGRIGRAEGGLMDLGGLEKDYRAEGGFVPIGKAEKADDVPARLSVNEFVFTADAVRNAGGGNVDEGAKVMERVMNHLEGGGQISRESQGLGGAQQMFETSERLSEVI